MNSSHSALIMYYSKEFESEHIYDSQQFDAWILVRAPSLVRKEPADSWAKALCGDQTDVCNNELNQG